MSSESDSFFTTGQVLFAIDLTVGFLCNRKFHEQINMLVVKCMKFNKIFKWGL